MSATILQRIAGGDAGAVQECVDQYTDLVWSVARRLTSGRADAEDAVQDVFIDLWKSAGRFDPTVASEPAFVVMIARRRLIDRLRRQTRRPQMSTLPEWSDGAPVAGVESATVDSRAVTTEEVQRAMRAMRMLSEEQRRVLHLSVHQGYTHAQIAEITGLPLGTVKTHVRRGLIKIREILGVAQPEAADAPESATNGKGPSR